MRRYESKYVQAATSNGVSIGEGKLAQIISELGEEGWEPVQFVYSTSPIPTLLGAWLKKSH